MRDIKLVYVAGPFRPSKQQIRQTVPARLKDCQIRRWYIEENIHIAKNFGLEVAKVGAMPVIPHANTDLSDYEIIQPDENWWLTATQALMMACHAVIFMPNWLESDGSIGEHKLASAKGMPIFYNLNSLKDWLGTAQ